ncbi:MAG: OmpA family protein [Bacteroidetes bacterium]|nr:OmpA family protein [Bacteroidota bacterium]
MMHFKLPGLQILVFLCFAMPRLSAAPANDHCSKAFVLKDVTGWCSSPRQFTNYAATPSGANNPICFPGFVTDADNDVWFKFTAVATVANISVIGAIKNNPGGTLQSPQFALYRGECSALREVACISDGHGYNIVETFVGNLVVGETYYLRVDGRNNKSGTFQLCVNNFNPVPSPSSDCPTAVVLCDKSGFTVPSMMSAGRNRAELPKGICVPEESQSAWYKWTCEESGTLTFTLSPIKPSDDLDFVLFLLPNGVTDCAMKIPIRCMAAGEDVGAPFSAWQKCSGATGLGPASTDIVENPGCGENKDNFLAPLRMEAGKSYALMVNNYQNTGNGFSVEFGGTGTFVGPVAHFTVSKLKIEKSQKLTIKNASTFPGGIKKWEWNFGVGATPQRATGAGPHTVSYGSAGKKSISLSIETSNGCQVTKVRTIEVTAPPPKPPKPAEPVRAKEPEIVNQPAPPGLEKATASTSENTESMAPDVGGPTAAPTLEEVNEALEIPPSEAASPTDTTQKTVVFDVKYVATIYFKADSFSLEPKDFETLQKIVEFLRASPRQIVIVEGHTNNIPTDDYCLKLGSNRADAVIGYLTSQGIDSQRITRKVLGKKSVVTKDISHPSRRKNQRVVIKLLQKTD